MRTNPFAWSRGPIDPLVEILRMSQASPYPWQRWSVIHRDLRTPKYKQRVVGNKKRTQQTRLP